ncbi:E3 ubiquitin-protein ligase trim-21 [Caenorhabditis elegans]|uniref:E3 ubiquitin-protein ligase trim-21 n=2 Tax=Caenorhabditis elegans TaxID=6239 RepID=TRI21_CAEEL|nr:E3 ubiquitin-protein ligase trim-21 [Caenorhabditis elegans]O16616.1 RecName: Full=E3 ubiquitin-protein ligase trim-21 [Caenorhabditis elegans]CCD61638.1 E3 ubiquitin-protein ligase trim-21 [Caenorhabditis elegans]|eukprot:NP_494234.1 Uncharacterized protein CELE_B0281.8 [Caenorhabditis elegans]
MQVPKCEICDDDFSSEEDGDHNPRNLKCSHTLCEGCIKKLLKNGRVVCPFCREPTEVPVYNIKSLHKNFSLIQMIKIVTKTTEVEKNWDNFPPKCVEHPYNVAEFACIESNCSSKNKLMCQTCEEFGAHKGHAKELLITKTDKFRKKLEFWINQLKLNIQNCTVKKNELEEAVVKSEQLLNIKVKKIKNHFDKIRQSVDKKEKGIIDETTAEATRIQKFNNEKITYLIDLQARHVKDIEAIEKQKNMTDIDLYNTGIDLPCFFGHLNIEVFRPADTKEMDIKLPNFKFEDGS